MGVGERGGNTAVATWSRLLRRHGADDNVVGWTQDLRVFGFQSLRFKESKREPASLLAGSGHARSAIFKQKRLCKLF
jgi:hypothetical protein